MPVAASRLSRALKRAPGAQGGFRRGGTGGYLCILPVVLLLSACAAKPLTHWQETLDITPATVASRPIPLAIARNAAWHDDAAANPHIHVYIEGDGLAYIRPNLPSADPTPTTPVALQLMAQDPAPALWLARPCQYRSPSQCRPALWTLERYGDEVLDSLHDAIRQSVPPGRPLILIGHSGGGTLALLLAPRLPDTVAVITVAGNLEVGRWTEHHGYSPLVGSHDPAQQAPRNNAVIEVHWVGGMDHNVPATWALKSPERKGRYVLHAPEDGHVCCWTDHWPDRLTQALKQIPKQ